MPKFRSFFLACLIALNVGCGKFSPLSPNLKNDIKNQDGKIEELKENQNGLMLDMLKLRQQNDVHARDIDSFQNGMLNLEKKNQNSGVQILQGDGGLMLAFGAIVVGMMLIFQYRKEAQTNQMINKILAQQIHNNGDDDLKNRVVMAAMNSPVEQQVLAMMYHGQN